MYLNVFDNGVLELCETDNLRALSVRANRARSDFAGLREDLREVVSSMDRDHAWLRRKWIVETSGRSVDPEWLGQFAKMIEFADSKGWVDRPGDSVRAHIEWTTEGEES